MQVTSKLRRSSVGYIHFCPGCHKAHSYVTDEGHSARWSFNGNQDKPTFTPSMRLFDNDGSICHYFLTEGKLIFLLDCRHNLAGKTVELPDLPEWMQGDKYGDGNP